MECPFEGGVFFGGFYLQTKSGCNQEGIKRKAKILGVEKKAEGKNPTKRNATKKRRKLCVVKANFMEHPRLRNSS